MNWDSLFQRMGSEKRCPVFVAIPDQTDLWRIKGFIDGMIDARKEK
jgi:hypothetical protein